jgi:hypothetical protein
LDLRGEQPAQVEVANDHGLNPPQHLVLIIEVNFEVIVGGASCCFAVGEGGLKSRDIEIHGYRVHMVDRPDDVLYPTILFLQQTLEGGQVRVSDVLGLYAHEEVDLRGVECLQTVSFVEEGEVGGV